MSIINKMLQDLDARGSQGAGAAPSDVRPVTREPWRMSLPVALVSAIGAVALAAGGYFALKFYQQRAAKPVAQVATVKEAAKPAAPALAMPAPVVAPVAEPLSEPVPVPAAQPLAEAPPSAAPPAPAKRPSAAPRVAAAPMKKSVRPLTHAPALTPAAVPAHDQRARAENEYRRALAALAEGRVGDSIATLEGALRMDPRHDGARQTVIGLLVENKRHDDAMRHLQAALAADARQPSMAMLLARMQIERGGDGIDTLMRTLPAAAGKPDYHAFLAGALARAGRHREAGEQYQAALRGAPDNGVWLMGLGIALQGEGRDADALAAYRRARASETLAPELQTFVERRINQLAR